METKKLLITLGVLFVILYIFSLMNPGPTYVTCDPKGINNCEKNFNDKTHCSLRTGLCMSLDECVEDGEPSIADGVCFAGV